MISALLPLAEATGHAVEAAGHAAAAGGGITEIFHTFGIKPEFFIAQAFNFALVAALLWFFAFKPVLATIDERKKQIAQGLQDAAEIKVKLAATQQESLAAIQKAQQEATAIIEAARKTAKEISERESKATADRVTDMLAKGQQAIELEHKKMLQEARTELATLVVKTTQAVLAKELSEADRSRFNEAATRELANV
jgi:F-type H+-transporting ATPase subunit b